MHEAELKGHPLLGKEPTSRSKSCAATLPSIILEPKTNQVYIDELVTDFHRLAKIDSSNGTIEPRTVKSYPNAQGQRNIVRKKKQPVRARRPRSSTNLPSIDASQPISYRWKCANQLFQKTKSASQSRTSSLSHDDQFDEITDDSGDDLTDCESDSEPSTLVSRQSVVSFEAQSDVKLTDDGFVPLLRKSPFKLFNSTLRFVYGDEVQLSVPPKMPKLTWKNSTMTPRVVRKILANSHIDLVDSGRGWIGYFGKHLKGQNYRKMRQGQKVNHFPGCFVLGRKDRLWRTISRYIAKFGHSEFGFIPTTYILPRDRRLLRENWKQNETYIMKPAASARGIGIKLVTKLDQVPKKRALIIQKYIKNPLLLNGLKWDLRIYVFVTSFSPLVAYIADDGLVRFSTEKYSLNTKNRYVHLTNYSINKKSKKFESNQDAGSATGHKWSMKILWAELQKEGYDTDKIWADIKDVVLKTLIAAESHIVQQVHKNCASQTNCFELFGFDIMLDRTGQVILLEVNVSPSLHSNSRLDADIKGSLISDCFNVTGFSPYKPRPTPKVTSSDRQANAKIFQRANEMTPSEMLSGLSAYHRWLILKVEYERRRKGDLQRLIPRPGVWTQYRRFFDTMRVDNAVLAAFEDEHVNDEIKRQNGAEKIHQIHLLHQN